MPILAAILFGAATPLSKVLLSGIDPWLMAGLLYVSSGIFVALARSISRFARRTATEAPLSGKDMPWLLGATLFGGILGPVLMMFGLLSTAASSASLFLNMEGVITAFVAWLFFREHISKRAALGMLLIFSGSIALFGPTSSSHSSSTGPLLIVLACLAWAIDNNLTRKISSGDPLQIVMIKSLLAGGTNIVIAFFLNAAIPSIGSIAESSMIGLFGYGVSLILFVLSLRHIGTSRTSSLFSIAPFIGAALSIPIFGEPLSPRFVVAVALMGVGVLVHLSEQHVHEHRHDPIEHDHRHTHDEHHQHRHENSLAEDEPHSHLHRHDTVRHAHPHYPDIHHHHTH